MLAAAESATPSKHYLFKQVYIATKLTCALWPWFYFARRNLRLSGLLECLLPMPRINSEDSANKVLDRLTPARFRRQYA